LFAERIIHFDHWIAFGLLSFLGAKIIAGSFRKVGCPDRECPEGICEDRSCPGGERPNTGETPLTLAHMLPLAIATSIDALAVGIPFAFLQVNIVPAVLFIGVTTLLLSMAGVKIGNVFGLKLKAKAEFAGGLILILIGLNLFLKHMNLFSFISSV
jgi:putative Mn2+ efflux pump MntP